MTQTAEDKRSDRERFYDEEIAPALGAIMQRCNDAGMSILVYAEYEPGNCGQSVAMQPSAGISFRLAEVAARSNGNVDTLIIALMKYATAHGHSSVILSQLGVPLSPNHGRAH